MSRRRKRPLKARSNCMILARGRQVIADVGENLAPIRFRTHKPRLRSFRGKMKGVRDHRRVRQVQGFSHLGRMREVSEGWKGKLRNRLTTLQFTRQPPGSAQSDGLPIYIRTLQDPSHSLRKFVRLTESAGVCDALILEAPPGLFREVGGHAACKDTWRNRHDANGVSRKVASHRESH
jgi:hypothetical protein